MVFELILIAISLAGFSWAGYLDLRYTEFPDWLAYGMIVSALGIRGAFSFIQNDVSIILDSVFVGVVFLGLGLFLYFMKQWGDGDAWLLGALGFLFPTKIFFPSTLAPFPVILLFNLFLISFFYLIVYTSVIGLSRNAVVLEFSKKFRKNLDNMFYSLVTVVGFWSAGVIISSHYISGYRIYPLLLLLPIILFVIVFFEYGKVIENNLFRRSISVKSLRVGDVLMSDKWRGLTEKEIKTLKKKGGKVWIKEGVRFSPVFIITVIITLLFGSPLVWLF